MTGMGADGWEIVNAWENTKYVNFCLAVVWQRKDPDQLSGKTK